MKKISIRVFLKFRDFLIKNENIGRSLLKDFFKITIIGVAFFAFVGVAFPKLPIATSAIILAPIKEEVLFRGVFLSGLKVAQKIKNSIYNCFFNCQVSENELITQKKFRIRTIAILFGMSHIFNHSKLIIKVLLVFSAIFAGLTNGYLKEKTDSIVLPVLNHSINNSILLIDKSHYFPNQMESVIILGWAVNSLAWHHYATKNEDYI